jgi:uncharacterized membrane protein
VKALAIDLAYAAALGLVAFLLTGEWIAGVSIAVFAYLAVCIAGVVLDAIKGDR